MRLLRATMTTRKMKNNSGRPIRMFGRRIFKERVELRIGTWNVRTFNEVGRFREGNI